MKKLLALIALPTLAIASDHNNLDSDRPLRFEDAYSAAHGAREFQLGLASERFRSMQAPFELKWGYAMNRDFSVGIEPTIGDGSTFGAIKLSHFQTLSGEDERNPAFGLRLSAMVPTNSDVARFGVKGVWSRLAGGQSKLHLNLGFTSNPNVYEGIIGYSKPMSFDQTILAEAGINSNEKWLGLGIRRQLNLRTVLDLGIEHRLGERGNLIRFGVTQSY